MCTEHNFNPGYPQKCGEEFKNYMLIVAVIGKVQGGVKVAFQL